MHSDYALPSAGGLPAKYAEQWNFVKLADLTGSFG
jgi:hypothetical protein